MKKMTITEKANAYDEALKYAMIYYKNGNEDMKTMMKTCFPVLGKSKDEVIREDLLDYFKNFPDILWSGNYVKDIIAWLEKQEEKDMGKNTIWKPKFKVGDWLQYRNAKPFFVEELTKQGYVNGDSCLPFDWENEIHLWSIQDAKDGDVLCVKYGNDEMPFIFTGKQDDIAYCALNSFGEFILELVEWLLNESVLPATKEQRDLLFQKMKEAGYEWDAYKKELKKIERKPAEWSEDDEQYLLVCKNALRKYEVTDKWDSNIISQWLDNKLKYLSPQNQWKVVDKDIYISEPTLVQLKDIREDDAFKGYVLCADHTLTPDVYKRYISLRDITNQNQWNPSTLFR